MNLTLAVAQFALVIILLLLDLPLCLASPQEAIHAPQYIVTQSGNFSDAHAISIHISTTPSTTTIQSTTTLLANNTATTESSRKANTFSTRTIGATSISGNHDAWGDWDSSSPTTNGPAASGDIHCPKTGGQGNSSGTRDTNDSSPGKAPP